MKLECGRITLLRLLSVTNKKNEHLKMSIHDRVSGYIKIYLLELGVVHPTPLRFPVPIPKQERKRAQHKHTGHCSWFVTTTNWRLDRRSWRPSFRSRVPSTKGALPHRAVYSAGPTQVILVVSTFSFNRLGFLLVLAAKVSFEKDL